MTQCSSKSEQTLTKGWPSSERLVVKILISVKFDSQLRVVKWHFPAQVCSSQIYKLYKPPACVCVVKIEIIDLQIFLRRSIWIY